MMEHNWMQIICTIISHIGNITCIPTRSIHSNMQPPVVP